MSQRIGDLAQQFIDALHALEHGGEAEVDALVQLFSSQTRLNNPILRLANQQPSGTEGARDFWIEYRRNFDEIHSDFHQVTVNDRAAGLFWVSKGSSAGTTIEYHGVSLLVFDDQGKIEYFQGYYDTRELKREIGMERAAGSSGSDENGPPWSAPENNPAPPPPQS